MKNLPEHSEWSWEQIREFLSTLTNFRTVSSNLLYLKQNIINQTSFLDEFYQTQVHIKVRIEAILRNIRSQNDIPLCSICNQNPVKLVKEPAKFSEVCSKDCSHALSHKKSKKTFMKKHGVEHPYQVPEIKEKLKTVFQERYGVNSPLALEEVQQKSKQTIRERYGVEHQCQSDEIMNKIKQTNLSNYGVEYTYQREEFKRKSKEVNRDRHGVDYYVQSNEFKTKYKQASIGRYGAEHHMQRNFSEETKQILSNREKLKELYDLHGGIKLSKQLGVWDCVVYDRLRKFDIPLNDSKVSAAERQVASFIESLGFDIITNSRDILNGKELDIYIPDKDIAVEFNGIYWHSSACIDKRYHLNKTEECERLGIQLIHIFEDEWDDRQEQIKNMLKSLLDKDDRPVVYARKCDAYEETNSNLKEFYNEHHLQGYFHATYNFVLKCEGNVVAAMSFLKRSDDEYELSRYATSCRVVGGFGKLLKKAKTHLKQAGVSRLVSFANKRYSTGNLYFKTGWVHEKDLPPDYTYLYGNKRQNKRRFRRKYLPNLLLNFDPSLTEVENTGRNGIYQIFDCGLMKFSIDLL